MCESYFPYRELLSASESTHFPQHVLLLPTSPLLCGRSTEKDTNTDRTLLWEHKEKDNGNVPVLEISYMENLIFPNTPKLQSCVCLLGRRVRPIESSRIYLYRCLKAPVEGCSDSCLPWGARLHFLRRLCTHHHHHALQFLQSLKVKDFVISIHCRKSQEITLPSLWPNTNAIKEINLAV